MFLYNMEKSEKMNIWVQNCVNCLCLMFKIFKDIFLDLSEYCLGGDMGDLEKNVWNEKMVFDVVIKDYIFVGVDYNKFLKMIGVFDLLRDGINNLVGDFQVFFFVQFLLENFLNKQNGF